MAKVTVEMTWERLAAMDDNGNKLWATPGAQTPYWNWQANFIYDEVVATVHDFRTDEGEQYEREEDSFEEDQIFSVEIEMPEPRRSE